MLAAFALRLACGLTAALLLLSPAQVNPRFYRTQFLTALGLAALAAVFAGDAADLWLWLALGAAMGLALLGSIAWMLEGAPGGRLLTVLTAAALALALGRLTWGAESGARGAEGGEWSAEDADTAGAPAVVPHIGWRLADAYTSAALLGAATTAMLIGHFYLIAPGMPLTPLRRLLGALFVCTLLRLAVAAAGLWYWTGEHSLGNLETILWLVPRWGLGLVGPLALGRMAWETARIRSTQSATGILYVVVIFCFLGEVTSQLLLARGGEPM